MNSTALGAGAEKAKDIIFISEAHEKFYYEKLKEVRYQDVYHKALCYCLGINDDTRRNVDSIYDFKTGCVKTECLHEGWQTSGSVKVVRMAFIALAFQGFFIMVCVAIYAVLVASVAVASNLHSALWSVAAYTVILCFSLFKTGSLSKSIFNAH